MPVGRLSAHVLYRALASPGKRCAGQMGAGVAAEYSEAEWVKQALATRRAGQARAKEAAVRQKLMTADEVVAELRSSMTIGIGGWGSRRKPMSLVRAILKSDLKDLTIVSFGGPDVGMLCAAGKATKVI